ncbi:redox-regulated ATPase YchF [Candidatus Dependentiae bacterium]|nr:MAG: redox-regulated ATPase YchF [Candidatus Dependentiae bacterium]
MGIKAGIVGLPNVGKSTLFNALTKSNIPAENYPFCTIEPHMAITEVPDKRLNELIEIYKPKKIIPAIVSFVDIAGLVKGAASGEGLGNQFLSHIREVDLILHVLRCFEDPKITHSGDTIDPVADYDIVLAELMLKDLESIDKRLEKLEKLEKIAKQKPSEEKKLKAERALIEQIRQALNKADAKTVKQIIANSQVKTVPLLTVKNFLIVANIAEEELDKQAYLKNPHYQTLVKQFGQERVIPICAKVEYELSQLNDEEAKEILGLLGLQEKGIDIIIRKSYKNLDLITFFTCGPKEVHAWPIKKGTPIRQASGEIHSDLERGFICAEVFNCKDLFALGSEAKLKEQGKIRTEGQDYIVQDGDIILIKFNV